MRILPILLTLSFLTLLAGCERGAPAPEAAGPDHSKHLQAAAAAPAAEKKA